ncbi:MULTISPECIES: MarR family winged helix-turn-helix transcriptional regulator [Saccharothrix]|uniref:MarR family transcriptional regulator n=1 Tax=Saccharothrix yanglingensis TaxID=659496 RepID=A0ABU0WUC4_9PSEU|nr:MULTISPECIES: MarR family transcriptional regulator [Saccharothrix]MBY8849288.1 MarR family transcriptional regulator [Saccharothrix sp. MB29]MDQ2583447.1 MarR family transcriptional regulator [Saccharothrix yanglingensis]MDU0293544.1 MarR family transcriptional regulator [Saccharothrix longispora]
MTADQVDPVEDATARLFLAIGRLSRLLRRTGSPGLGPGAVSALATLTRCGPMRLGDLAAKEGVAPPTLSRIVAALVEAGYVKRDPDPQDGRAWLATPTPEGETMVSGVRSARVRELQRRIEELTPEHRDALLDALPALEVLVGEVS